MAMIFLAETAPKLQTLAELAERHDLEGIADLAHHLKGAAANLAGEALALAAFDLEQAAAGRDPARLAIVHRELQAEYQRFRKALTDFLGKQRTR